jgi:hypothetical protein
MRYGKCFAAIVVLASCLVHAALAAAQERAVSFANVRFGADPATVQRAMDGMKLSLRARTADQSFPFDQRFEGELKGSPVLVSALYDAQGRLEKVLVSFLTPDEECVSLYRALKQELRQQFGAPVVDVERWDYPYNNGGHVGQEHFAIRIGRGRLATAWDRTDAGSTDGGVSLMTTEDVIVRLAYESSRWAAESERRKQILSSESEGISGDSTGRDDEGGPRMRNAR